MYEYTFEIELTPQMRTIFKKMYWEQRITTDMIEFHMNKKWQEWSQIPYLISEIVFN